MSRCGAVRNQGMAPFFSWHVSQTRSKKRARDEALQGGYRDAHPAAGGVGEGAARSPRLSKKLQGSTQHV
jgi:hypothetical protein